MAEINRYSRPSSATYQSQFVPTELPADLMAQALYTKQAKADRGLAAAVELGEWNQRALAGHDTQYVKDIRTQLEDFSKKAMTMDRTSPEFQREYLRMQNKIKKDEGLSAISASVARDDAFQKRWAALKAKGDHAAADAEKAQYEYSRSVYTAEGGQGFKGPQLYQDITNEGVDLWEGKIKYFKDLKESGSEVIKALGDGISYKNGWTGVSSDRIKKQLNATYDDYLESPAGKQQYKKELLKQGLVGSTFDALSPEDKEKVGDVIAEEMHKDFLEAGNTYIRGKSTTNRDSALNSSRKEAKEAEAVLMSTEQVALAETAGATRDKQIKSLDVSLTEAERRLQVHKNSLATNGRGTMLDRDAARLEQVIITGKQRKNQLQREHTKDWQRISRNTAATLSDDTKAKYSQYGLDIMTKAQHITDPDLRKKVMDLAKLDIVDGASQKEQLENLQALISSSNISQYGDNNQMLFSGDATSDVNKRLMNEIVGIQNKQLTEVRKFERERLSAWNEELYTANSGKSVVQSTNVQLPTGTGTQMEARNSDIKKNPEGYKFKTADGNIFDMKSVDLLDFKGGSYTLGNAIGEDNIGISGQVMYREPVKDEDGNIKSYRNRVISLNAIPQSGDESINNRSLAREAYKVAALKKQSGNIQEAAAAEALAVSLEYSNIFNAVQNFEIDSKERNQADTTIPITGVGEDGYTETTFVYLEKATDGGFRYDIGGKGIVKGEGSNASEIAKVIGLFINGKKVTN